MDEEVKQEQDSVVKENLTTENMGVPEMENTIPDQSERIRLENEAYQRHVSALMEELQEIRSKFQIAEPVQPDPFTVLSGEVNSLKSGFEELKQIMTKRVEAQQENPQQVQPQFNQVPQQAFPYFPQQGVSFFPQIQPMFQTSTIMPAPALPYIATTTPMPTNMHVPQFNFNSGNGNIK